MKALLIQVREDPWKADWERKSFLQATGLGKREFCCLNLFDREFTLSDFLGFDAVIIGGSKFGVEDKIPNINFLRSIIHRAAENKTPMLGVCFGAQIIAHTLGGQVIFDGKNQEFGTFSIQQTVDGQLSELFQAIPHEFPAQCAHHDFIVNLPPCGVVLANSVRCKTQAYKILDTKIYGVQFHPERSLAAYKESLLYELNSLPESAYESTGLSIQQILESLRETNTEILLRNFLGEGCEQE